MEIDSSETRQPVAVLDTNVALDWLLFADPGVAALAAAICTGRLRWHACAAMRDELQRVLGSSSVRSWNPDSERILFEFDRWVQLCPHPAPAPRSLLCNDPDDRVFVDLALACGARWLVTHDRALLRLARRARGAGLLVLRPAQGLWP